MMEQSRQYVIKQLEIADISPGLLDAFAHSQKITKKWVKENGEWKITDVSVLREWSAEKRIWITEYMCQQIHRGGITVGAFFGEQLIGFCCMDGTISGNSAKYANLTMLFIDDNWKRNGIGRLLLHEARQHGIKLGADKIFISAIPSEETIAFYLSMGCNDAKEIVEEFVDSEDDRYLELAISPMVMPCYCGHNCAKCITYIATQRNDDKLREQSRRFYKEMFGLDIPPQKFNCDGGRSENVFELCEGCPFVKCCKEHGVDFCSECPEYPCKEILDYQAKYVNKCNQI